MYLLIKNTLKSVFTLPDYSRGPELLKSSGIIELGAFCVELRPFYYSKRISVPMSYISLAYVRKSGGIFHPHNKNSSHIQPWANLLCKLVVSHTGYFQAMPPPNIKYRNPEFRRWGISSCCRRQIYFCQINKCSKTSRQQQAANRRSHAILRTKCTRRGGAFK